MQGELEDGGGYPHSTVFNRWHLTLLSTYCRAPIVFHFTYFVIIIADGNFAVKKLANCCWRN